MHSFQLPKHVLAFLVAHVDHRTKLDFVLFLHRSAQSTPVWIAASELEVSKNQIRDMARELGSEIVRFEGDKLELAPRAVEDRLAIVDLATWYTLDKTRILHILRSLGRGA